MEPAKNRLLARSYDIVPLALGIAFSFLGYFLGICLLAVERKPGIASEQIGSQQMSNKL
jgi:hypothetical protein